VTGASDDAVADAGDDEARTGSDAVGGEVEGAEDGADTNEGADARGTTAAPRTADLGEGCGSDAPAAAWGAPGEGGVSDIPWVRWPAGQFDRTVCRRGGSGGC
jgi:hypothetical protein